MKPILTAIVPIVFAVIGLLVGLTLGAPHETPHDHHHADGVTYTCSMHPEVRSDEPGTCPICGMALTPAAAEPAGDASRTSVTLSERARALARIRTTPVKRRNATDELSLLGRIEQDETRVRTVTAWTAGRIDRLHIAATGATVRKGQTIATVYSPEIYTAQRDLIQSTRQLDRLGDEAGYTRAAAEATVASATQRLRLLGVSASEIAEMAKESEPRTQVRIHSSHAGTVVERAIDEGAYVERGTPIYRIADLSKVWVQLDAYEADLAELRVGQKVRLTVDALPGATFDGEVVFIDPQVDARQRTTRVRVELPNDGSLRPGMFARAAVATEQEEGLVIPRSAPLFLGARAVVFVATPADDGDVRYDVRDVVLGARTGETYRVIDGLEEGEDVVTHGAFAIDADLQIRGGKSLTAGAY